MGFMGAAWMTLATEVVVFGVSLRLILRTLELSLPNPARMARTVLAAALMGAGLALLRLVEVPLGVLVLVACISYPALLFGLRALVVDDVRVLLRRGAVA
jgi:O-antigen/teichoic acid export membrane protein